MNKTSVKYNQSNYKLANKSKTLCLIISNVHLNSHNKGTAHQSFWYQQYTTVLWSKLKQSRTGVEQFFNMYYNQNKGILAREINEKLTELLNPYTYNLIQDNVT
ncbi:hypothetical protein CHS0354_025904 [Potamilus streckersoni]|uniref:Uncharacterized protein n=1 Tax=Potamilus streckersoni TaxID=2493646 RepID=A0AAE0W6W6_9BIVA|nr:hypothetical protein CHS0354_025904 [Potamilus streckersoni]